MTVLTRWPDTDPTTSDLETADPVEIAADLESVGVRFEQWPLRPELAVGASADEVLEAYRPEVEGLKSAHGFDVVDVAQLHPSDDPEWAATAAGARRKFLAEHTHAEDEVRFFVQGSGIFYLHLGDAVRAVRCEAGDLISVPADTPHWFDMGNAPDFTAIRFFLDPDGWVGNFTGSEIGTTFPDFDTLAGSSTDSAD